MILTHPNRTIGALLDRRPRVDGVCLAVAAVLAASGVVFLGVAAFSTRPWIGPVAWRKPATFGLSFGVTLAAVTWIASYLRLGVRERTLLLGVFAVDCVVEVGGITLQALRDVPSHLNRSTPFNSVVAVVLAVGGAVLIVVLGRMAFLAFAGRTDATASMRRALRAGFALLIAGLLSGAAMIARGSVAMNTGTVAHAYAVTGFLKGVHGITLHGIVVLPAFAWWLAHRDLTEHARVRYVTSLTGLYVVAAVVALVVAVVGQFPT